CSYVVLILSACQILSPGFVSLTPESKAPCLCYSDTAWAPDLFDGAIETCASWAQTADPVDYPALVTYEGICTSIGDILMPTPTPTQPPPVITPSPSSSDAGILVNSGCALVGSALSFCDSVTPGFTNLLPEQMATCLCYSSTAWSPNGFDSPVSTCAEFVKTAS
ncbi:hypothetical protein DL98DRAFT_366218, partial [Cadophora sp. DSE1049]